MAVLPRTLGPLSLSVLVAVLVCGPALAQEGEGGTIRQYQLEADGDSYRLVMKEVPRPVPGAQEVLVRVRAASLNHRDRVFLEGQSGSEPFRRAWLNGLVPVGDGAAGLLAD